jgi:predicted outer membrane lipoprotein
MADIDVTRRGPGLRPWILGILLLAALAALGMWLLEERGDDRALDGVSAEAG